MYLVTYLFIYLFLLYSFVYLFLYIFIYFFTYLILFIYYWVDDYWKFINFLYIFFLKLNINHEMFYIKIKIEIKTACVQMLWKCYSSNKNTHKTPSRELRVRNTRKKTPKTSTGSSSLARSPWWKPDPTYWVTRSKRPRHKKSRTLTPGTRSPPACSQKFMLLAAYPSIAVHRAFISLSCVVRCGCGTRWYDCVSCEPGLLVLQVQSRRVFRSWCKVFL